MFHTSDTPNDHPVVAKVTEDYQDTESQELLLHYPVTRGEELFTVNVPGIANDTS